MSSEPDLWREYKGCSRPALGTLWTLHSVSLHRQALWQSGGNVDVAESSMSRLGLKLAKPRTKESYDAGRAWRPWTGAILNREVYEELRGRGRDGRDAAPQRGPDDPPFDPEDPVFNSPLENAIDGDWCEALAIAMTELTDVELCAIVWHNWYGWTFQQIADQLAGHPSPVHNGANLHGRAIRKLKAALLQRFREDDQ